MRFARSSLAIWGGILLSAGAALAQSPSVQVRDDIELLRQQLASVHDQSDARERELVKAIAKIQAEAEAQKTTLIEWLQAAQGKITTGDARK